jgi:hypothetical protein
MTSRECSTPFGLVFVRAKSALRLQSNSSFGTSDQQKPSQMSVPSFRRRVPPFVLRFGKKVMIPTSGGCSGEGLAGNVCSPPAQKKQCSQAAVSFHPGRTNAFRPDRVPEAASLATIRGQTVRLPRNHAATGREPRGADFGYQFPEKVCLRDAFAGERHRR